MRFVVLPKRRCVRRSAERHQLWGLHARDAVEFVDGGLAGVNFFPAVLGEGAHAEGVGLCADGLGRGLLQDQVLDGRVKGLGQAVIHSGMCKLIGGENYPIWSDDVQQIGE